jgi:GDPmannose 4,6-dehydratase
LAPPEKRALIIGCGGQDGTLLFRERSTSCTVLGVDVATVRSHGAGADRAVAQLPPRIDIENAEHALALVGAFVPDEVYYLAARHHSSEERPDDATELRVSLAVNCLAFVNVLEAVRRHASRARVFYAGSSHMFGSPRGSRQDESTPFQPENPYAISKVAGAHACALFRARHGIHVSVGILYNHASPLRAPHFVSQRIAQGARSAAKDPAFKLALGSLGAVVDWGYAPDYVDAMTRIVGADSPDDYVIATGVPHTVQDFVDLAFRAVGVDWRAHVVVDPLRVHGAASRPAAGALVGDSSRLRARTGWEPTVSFEEMVSLLVAAVP